MFHGLYFYRVVINKYFLYSHRVCYLCQSNCTYHLILLNKFYYFFINMVLFSLALLHIKFSQQNYLHFHEFSILENLKT